MRMSPGKSIWPLMACFLFLSTPLTAAPANWWNPNWSYRIPLSIEAGNSESAERPLAATINFTVALKAARSRGIFVSNTVRMVEINQAGTVIDESIPLQFDFAPDYHATRNAQGTLLFLPKSGAATARRFHLYFETHEARNLTTLLAPYRLSETLRMSSPELSETSSEQVVVNVGEIEIRPAKVAMRSRTVTIENEARTALPGAEFNVTEPLWKSKPEHQFFAGYCTWYAARKWKEFTGAPVTWSGDGGRWFDNAADEGRNVSDDPKAAVKGAIMVWTRRGSAGHVAFVEAVSEEGVFITEMNARGRWMVSDAFLPFTNLDKGTKYRFKGYILPE
jgi:surface antigen